MASGICSSLTSLEFDDVSGSRKKLPKDNAVPILLAACPNLEELKVPASVMDERNLAVHASARVEAREGAPSLLKVLDMSSEEGYSWHWNVVTWEILSKLGTQLPLLEVCSNSVILHAILPFSVIPEQANSLRHRQLFQTFSPNLSRLYQTSESFKSVASLERGSTNTNSLPAMHLLST